MRFRAEQHLRRQLDFHHVRTHGRRHDCGAFMLWYVRQAAPVVTAPATTAPPVAGSVSDPIPSQSPVAGSVSDPIPSPAPLDVERSMLNVGRSAASPPSRLGVVASKSAVGNAVQRARAKRRLREAFRQHQLRVPAGYDVLLVARGSLNRLEYREIEQRFSDACRKIFPSVHA